jgi:3-methyladenine DNA glycosylase Tag
VADDPQEARGVPPRVRQFDPREVAKFGARQRRKLMNDAGIVRSR